MFASMCVNLEAGENRFGRRNVFGSKEKDEKNIVDASFSSWRNVNYGNVNPEYEQITRTVIIFSRIRITNWSRTKRRELMVALDTFFQTRTDVRSVEITDIGGREPETRVSYRGCAIVERSQITVINPRADTRHLIWLRAILRVLLPLFELALVSFWRKIHDKLQQHNTKCREINPNACIIIKHCLIFSLKKKFASTNIVVQDNLRISFFRAQRFFLRQQQYLYYCICIWTTDYICD